MAYSGQGAAIEAGRAYVSLSLNDANLAAGMRRAQANLKRFGEGLTAMGGKLLGLGSSLAAPLGLSAKIFSDFESNMARVKAILQPTAEQFGALSREAKRLGAETIFSAGQAAEAMAVFAQAGRTADQILKATGPTLDLAASAQLGLAEAAGIANRAMTGLGVPATELARVTDVLAKAATIADTNVSMLGEGFRHVGPVAKRARMSLEETVAAMALLSDQGLQGEMAGTGLRAVLEAILTPTSEGAAAFKRLGISAYDTNGTFRGLAKTLEDMRQAMAPLSEQARNTLVGDIFSIRAGATFAALTADNPKGDLVQFTRTLRGSAGTAARVAGVQMDTLKGSVDVLTSSLEGLAITVGEHISPVLREWGKWLAWTANLVDAFAKENGPLLRNVLKWGAVAVVAGGALTALGLAVGTLTFAIGSLATVIGGAIALLVAMGKAWVVFMLTPLGAVYTTLLFTIGSILAADDVLGRLWQRLRGVGMESQRASVGFARLGEGMRMTNGYMLETSRLADRMGVSLRGAAGGGVREFFQFADIFKTAWKGVVAAVASGDLALAMRIAGLGASAAWAETTGSLEGIWSGFKLDFSKTWAELVGGLRMLWGNLWDSVYMGAVQTWDGIQDLWDALIANLKKGWASFAGFFRRQWAEITPFGSWSGEAAGQRKGEVNADVAARKDAADQEAAAAIAARGAAREASRKYLERERRRREDEIIKDTEAFKTLQDRARNQPAPNGALDKAKQALGSASALAELQQIGQEIGKWAADTFGKYGFGGKKLPDLSGGPGLLGGRVDVAGTFSGLLVGQLGARNLSQSIAQNTGKAVEEIRGLRNDVKDNPLRFS